MPKRFFLGTLLLYGLVLGTYGLVLTPLQHEIPNWQGVVPFLAFASFYIGAGLFLLILGRGHVSRWAVLISIITVFALSSMLTVGLRAQRLYDVMDPSRVYLRHFAGVVAAGVAWLFRGESALAVMVQFAVMVIVEEGLKLLPVFLLVYLGRIKTPHGAMLCGALAGLAFGTVEAGTYGYLEYPIATAPITTYLTRFFVMAPLHGVWDALAGGFLFFLSNRWRTNETSQPEFGAYLSAYAAAVVFHILHNSLQAVIGPAIQIVSVFALLAPLYLMSKSARRHSEAMGEPLALPFIGDLHLLILSMSTLFLSVSLLFSWAMGLAPQAPAESNSTIVR
jgi:hypothetical protein